MLLLRHDYLVNLYMHVIAGSLLFLLEIASRVYAEEESETDILLGQSGYLRRQILQGTSIIAVSVFITWCLNLKNSILKIFPNVYLLPILVRLLDFPLDALEISLWISSRVILIIVGIYLMACTPPLVQFARQKLFEFQTTRFFHGTFHTLIILANAMFDPTLFIIYWAVLFLTYGWMEYAKFQSWSDYHVLFLLIMSEICDSPLTLLASCLVTSSVSHGIIRLANSYLNSCKPHAQPSTTLLSGITEGTVMFLLSLQTGLIELKLSQRLGVMSIILFIVAASLFQTILEITHPVLLGMKTNTMLQHKPKPTAAKIR